MTPEEQNTHPSVSVITLHRVANYGSVLQAYATEQILTGLGYSPQFIDYWRPDQVDRLTSMVNYSRVARLPFLKGVYSRIRERYIRESDKLFSQFIETTLPLTKPYYTFDELKDDPPVADINMVGSDQVWNFQTNFGGTEPFLLDFLPDGQHKVAFSSSIGQESLDPESASMLKRALNDFDWISVREESAKKQLATLGFECDVVCDPTLMLNQQQWREFSSPSLVDDKYVLQYSLGHSSHLRRAAAEISRDSGAKLTILSPHWWLGVERSNEIRLPLVSEFTSLFANASHIVTDSFHGVSFALNFGVPFTVVLPKRFGTRLTNILVETDTSSRIWGGESYDIRADAAFWEDAQRRVESLRRSSISIAQERLRKVLGAPATDTL